MSQDFFISNLGSWVYRTDPNSEQRTFQLAKPKPGKEYAYAAYYHSLQEIGVKFAPIVTIHRSNQEECLACSS